MTERRFPPPRSRSWRAHLIAGLHVAVIDEELVVSLPPSNYSVTYYKQPHSPGLLAKNISHRDDPQTEIKLSEFLAEAWRAANDKARELGWIV
jgi:predicted alpha/beta hydrolase family esterase